MRRLRGLLLLAIFTISLRAMRSQTSLPVLGNIEGPYNPIQSTVTIGGKAWGPGLTAYGPVGTPLVLTGSNLGGGGIVQFWAYKNGAPLPVGSVPGCVVAGCPVQAVVTLWTSNMLITTVPSGALSGLVTVSVEGEPSNPLPFMVIAGSYSTSASCPAGPTSTELQIITSSLHDGAVTQSYSATLQAQGGTGSYSWSVSSGTLPAGLTLNSSTGTISGTPTAATGFNPAPLTFKVIDSGSPPQTVQAEISITIEAQQMNAGTIYSYAVGYDNVGNVSMIQDASYNAGPGVMGAWGYQYDTLNRLTTANATWPDGTQQYYCWNYDAFGNRLQQEMSSASFVSPSGGASTCNAQASAYLATEINTLLSGGVDPGTNRVMSTNARGTTATVTYDAAGDPNTDGVNQYLYDAEGRVCAVQSTLLPGSTTLTGYVYDADGNRVAKGTIGSGSISSIGCDPSSWVGFQLTENYVLGLGGEELTMLDGSNNWQRTNVYAGGKLIGTYDLVTSPSNPSTQIPWLHFHLEDALGTRRMQASGMISNLGQPETDYQTLPFGDQLGIFSDPYADQTADDATTLYFTGKERDSESGNDYFGARYYGSSMGRFLSPDPLMASAKVWDPQTWNRYTYGRNNPLKMIDPTGLAEVTAAQCANDSKCVTVNVHVIWDKHGNQGGELTDKQKAAFEKGQLQEAKDQYGNADIHLNVTYGSGEISGGKFTGDLQKDALNVVVSDQVQTDHSDMTKGGVAISWVNQNSDNLAHEMAHQFMGDTQGAANWVMTHDPSGISGAVFDAFHDVANDSERAWMNHLDQRSGPMSYYPLASAFHHNAEVFQKSITPTTKPQ